MPKKDKKPPTSIYITPDQFDGDNYFIYFDESFSPEEYMSDVEEDEIELFEYKLVGKKKIKKVTKVTLE